MKADLSHVEIPPAETTAPASPTASRLPEFLDRFAACNDEFITYDNGYRGWTYSYREIGQMAGAIALRLRSQGARKGDRIVIWSENRPGWVAALWACVLRGMVIVPVDPLSSLELFRRISQNVQPIVILLGNRVPAVPAKPGTAVWLLSELEQQSAEPPGDTEPLSADDIAEIIFTSGTTAEPKGVVITHRNLAANLRPVEELIAPNRRYLNLFGPVRGINLLPMSHLFGQSATLFIAPLVPASIVFLSGTSAREIARQIRRRKVTAVAAVPRVLEVLRDFVADSIPEAVKPVDLRPPWPLRWWRARRVHRLFGWRFCCFVVGGAPLPPDLENFWANAGFAVVQGYGLTETAPIISVNDPFDVQRGTTGKPLAGVEVKIADDGEILVRGDNVTRGYFNSPAQTAAAFRDGWFLTGDIGEWDAGGNLVIRGRKKEMIVTPEGLNVFPEDVETLLSRIPGVRDCAVIGRDRVHAVLIPEPGARPEEIVRKANERLEEHQKIRSWSLWTAGELPRTRATRKLRRAEIAQRLEPGPMEPVGRPESLVVELLQKYAPGREITPETTLDQLGLSSLDRVELMMDLETRRESSIDEAAFASAKRVADLEHPMPLRQSTPFPRSNRTAPARLLRRASLALCILPITRWFARAKVSGLQHLQSIHGPVIFAANHESHLDTPVILASLPPEWRFRIAVAMWKEYFDAHFFPGHHSLRERFISTLTYRLVTLLFNAFPIPQTEASVRESLRYAGELAEAGWSILIFPEGERSASGVVGGFHPGVGMLASRLRLPIVPVRILGVNHVLPPSAVWPRRGAVEVRFGAPLSPSDSYSALTQKTADRVRAL